MISVLNSLFFQFPDWTLRQLKTDSLDSIASFAWPKQYFFSNLSISIQFSPKYKFYFSLVPNKIIWEAGDMENFWVFFLLHSACDQLGNAVWFLTDTWQSLLKLPLLTGWLARSYAQAKAKPLILCLYDSCGDFTSYLPITTNTVTVELQAALSRSY